MTKEYIAGFFDADGYITVSKSQNNETPSVTVGFTNCERPILEEIQKFIFDDLKLKGVISRKSPQKINHRDSFDLKYSRDSGINLLSNLPIKHPKKVKRLEIAIELSDATIRNGRYTENQKKLREKIVSRFLATI